MKNKETNAALTIFALFATACGGGGFTTDLGDGDAGLGGEGGAWVDGPDKPTGGEDGDSSGGTQSVSGGSPGAGGAEIGGSGGESTTGGAPGAGGVPDTGGTGGAGTTTECSVESPEGCPVCHEQWTPGEAQAGEIVQQGADIFSACVLTSEEPLSNFNESIACNPGTPWVYRGFCPTGSCDSFIVWSDGGNVGDGPPRHPGTVVFYEGNFWELKTGELDFMSAECPPNALQASAWCADYWTYELRTDCL